MRLKFTRNPSLILLGLAGLCWAAYAMIGATVDEQGILHEPFALIPIGYLFLVTGILSWLLVVILFVLKRARN